MLAHAACAAPKAAIKYFLIGAFATGFLVYGMALVYGTTGGELSYAGIAEQGRQRRRARRSSSSACTSSSSALAFKVAAVPFHMWAPDAYEGAPTPVTGFMAAGRQGGGVRRHPAPAGRRRSASPAAGLRRHRLGARSCRVLAALTMTLGNLAALRQENIKRMLAYSSIAHAGYLLIGVVGDGPGRRRARKPAVLFYLLAYTFTTLGAFGVVAWIGNRKDERLFVDDWAGARRGAPGAWRWR